MLLDVIADTLVDALKLLPFLFLTYLAMEYIEHKAGDKAEELVEKAGGFGPLIGSVLGMVPQCGFSAAASNLYAGRIITLGTLISIFLSTSDEMLPILDKLIFCAVPESSQKAVKALIANEELHYVEPHHNRPILDGLWRPLPECIPGIVEYRPDVGSTDQTRRRNRSRAA